jgi:hypothetical protein
MENIKLTPKMMTAFINEVEARIKAGEEVTIVTRKGSDPFERVANFKEEARNGGIMFKEGWGLHSLHHRGMRKISENEYWQIAKSRKSPDFWTTKFIFRGENANQS